MKLHPNPIIIESVYPEIDAGRYPVKREVGEVFSVWADIFREGHESLHAVLCYREENKRKWREVEMRHHSNDRFVGSFPLAYLTRYEYTVKAWPDPFGSWVRDTRLKKEDGQDITLELKEAVHLLEEMVRALKGNARKQLQQFLDRVEQPDILLSDEAIALVKACAPRTHLVSYGRMLEVLSERERARFSSWYEFFPRSQGSEKGATFAECEKRLPAIAAMGFDVVYLPPIHPIGKQFRKGKNNALTAEKGDPGCPYAVCGHKKIHPELGTEEDFRHFVRAAKSLGMEVALDFALQCAPDHPYVKAHPEWFRFRPDGTIRYAENPPKKYQDIVNVNFECAQWQSLWEEWRSVILFWIVQGVTIFRVDNPHTKPFPFWEWLIRSIQDEYKEVIFLSEAFTRPKVMMCLAKLGFTQSYTYFTWRNTKAELMEYLTELQGLPKEYFRPNFFPTTPDILPFYLQTSGRAGFMIRVALAAILSANYGIYSGFELCESCALPGKEEYAHSEKYEIKPRNWEKPGNIIDFITHLNRIRKENRALQYFSNLRFHPAHNDAVLFFEKWMEDGSNTVFCLVNLDPHHAQEAWIEVPIDTCQLEDLFTKQRFEWRGKRQHVRLAPDENPVALFRVHHLQGESA